MSKRITSHILFFFFFFFFFCIAVASITGTPFEQLKRVAVIARPARHAMQSGAFFEKSIKIPFFLTLYNHRKRFDWWWLDHYLSKTRTMVCHHLLTPYQSHHIDITLFSIF
jgi:hypothetical protein